MGSRLQPYGVGVATVCDGAATLCDRGCSPMLSRLQPFVPGSSSDAQEGVHLLHRMEYTYYSLPYKCSCFAHAFPAPSLPPRGSPGGPAALVALTTYYGDIYDGCSPRLYLLGGRAALLSRLALCGRRGRPGPAANTARGGRGGGARVATRRGRHCAARGGGTART